jgi:polysaccharide pyruvyl transferase WcaK-like protein
MDELGRGNGATPYAGGVALISPCGWGNLGDAAIVDSVIHAVRRRMPDAPLLGLTLNPSDTARRHGIPAFTCTGFSFHDYGVTDDAPSASPSPFANSDRVDGDADGDGDGQAAPSRARSKRGARAILRRVAWATPGLFQAWSAAKIVRADIRHRRLLAGPTDRLSHVVVAGGGQLDDYWGGALGHPYVLWRWARHARSVGSRFLVLSVGTGTLSPLSRLLVRSALASADYRSFRDEGSRRLVGDRSLDRDPVVPDLAYGFPVELYAPKEPTRTERPVVAISPMAHCDPRVGPERDEARYRSYLGRLTVVAARLLETGHDLLLYGTVGSDNANVEDLREQIAQSVSSELLDRVAVPKVTTLGELFAALAPVRAVLASRLHGVLLAHLYGLPVAALSYERKVGELMKTMGYEEYCFDIDTFRPSDAVDRLGDLLARRAAVSDRISRLVATKRGQVDEQYDRVFGRGPSLP